VARGICRSEQGKSELAANDFNYAASLYSQGGEKEQAMQLKQAAEKVADSDEKGTAKGNGAGSKALSGALSALQFLAPIAAKAFLPMGF
jgi:hypothetical protein